jgi:hypothetical protein
MNWLPRPNRAGCGSKILAQQLGPQRLGVPQARTPEEIREWLDSLAQFSDRIPPLPENITRDWIYQHHN